MNTHFTQHFEGGAALLLGVNIASVPPIPTKYLQPGWGDSEKENPRNPFYQFMALNATDQQTMSVWKDWIMSKELYFKDDLVKPQHLDASLEALWDEWAKKNEALRKGYESLNARVAQEKPAK